MLAASKSKKVNSPNALAFEDAYSIKAFFCIFIALEATVDDWKILWGHAFGMCWKTHPCSGVWAVFLGAGVKGTRGLRIQEFPLNTCCSSWLGELVFACKSAYSNRIPWIAAGEEQSTWGYLKGHLPWLTVVHHQSAWTRIPFVTDCSPLPCSESEYFVICSSLSIKHLPFCNPLSLSIAFQLGYTYSWQTLTLHCTEIPASGKSANVDSGTWSRLQRSAIKHNCVDQESARWGKHSASKYLSSCGGCSCHFNMHILMHGQPPLG